MTPPTVPFDLPDLVSIERTRALICDHIHQTPIHQWSSPELSARLGDMQVVAKLELFQVTGTFKPRSALANALSLDTQQQRQGVVAVSAGNHAIATAYAAQRLGMTAKVVMPKSANPVRIEACRRYQAEIILVDQLVDAYELATGIQRKEGRALIHPFEGPFTALGTGTLGVEFHEQAGKLDALVIAVGGGGLCAGVASAFLALQPHCMIYGVEPATANTMYQSLRADRPVTIPEARSVADSLAPPFALPYSFECCKRLIRQIALVSDAEIVRAAALMFSEMKLCTEPAGATALAALCGPLRQELQGKRVGLIVCGGNIDADSFAAMIRPSPRTGDMH